MGLVMMRKLIALLLVIGVLWFIYEDSFEKAGLRGVYEEMREDIVEIRNHPFIDTALASVREGIAQLSGKISDTLNDNASDETPIENITLVEPVEQPFSIHNIELGDSRTNVEAVLGEPQRSTLNEYGVDWVSYHDNYRNFVMVAYNDHRVCGLYTNQNLLSSTLGITFDSRRDDVLQAMPEEPLGTIRKGFIQYRIENDGEFDLFELENSYVTFFYDLHRSSQVTAVLWIDKEMEDMKKDYFAEPREALREGFEYQLFDLTNAERVKHGLKVLAWEESARETVRAHSRDMAENNYFSHTNLAGQSPFDRLAEDAISYSTAGENLATGQSSAIFAHEGLMNSAGHRENKLRKDYEKLAVGVAFNRDSQPFFTENYLAD